MHKWKVIHMNKTVRSLNSLLKVLGIRVLSVKGWRNILEVVSDRDRLKHEVLLNEIDVAVFTAALARDTVINLDFIPEYLGNREKSSSGFRQDLLALLLNNFKKNGTFIEVGACDGLATSNTLLLEREFGWQGILIEPAKVWHSAIALNRSSIIDLRCAWKTTGERIKFVEKSDSCTSTVLGSTQSESFGEEVYWVETVTVAQLIEENKTIESVDFLSVDTEGSELEVLLGFPFDNITPNFICVEHNHEEPKRSQIRELLKIKGYSIFLETHSNVDDWFHRT